MKIAIGCLVQWYESEIAPLYFQSLRQAIDNFKEQCPEDEVIVDIVISYNQELEKCLSTPRLVSCIRDIQASAAEYDLPCGSSKELISIADYRRTFNDVYCDSVDVLVWGESDMLVPRQMFTCLQVLHNSISSTTPKYLATFATCKMWDSSWKELEHPNFTDKPFIEGDTTNWWSLRYPMTLVEMNAINVEVTSLQINKINPHKFNGCGLVISSEVIRSGVNIPKAMFFIHEDTAFMNMTKRVLGDIPQYHFKNILLVHNRKHPLKRKYVEGEQDVDPTNPSEQRGRQWWYWEANRKSEENCYNLFNPSFKAWTWKDVFKLKPA